jgi:hypothetical protein
MISIFKLLENSIENVDTTALEKHLNSDFDVGGNDRQKHLRDAFKSLKSPKIINPLSDIFAKQDKVVDHFKKTASDLNANRDAIDINAASQFDNQKILRWWEITHPEWQPM